MAENINDFTEVQVVFNLPVIETMTELLDRYDTDGDKKITLDDAPDLEYELTSTNGQYIVLNNVYHISNLLQELALASDNRRENLLISLNRIQEPPASRITRRVREEFWDNLTRTVDADGLKKLAEDEKMHDSHKRIYVPYNDVQGIDYYLGLQENMHDLEVIILPPVISPQYVQSLNHRPGILALDIKNGKGVPFTVPGGRFNEMYGWDSYFQNIGLLLDNRTDLAKGTVDNFCYQIKYYGKILNANRSYYLTRTQPPFLTSAIREVFDKMEAKDKDWLKNCVLMAIREYETVWMSDKRYTPETGLNRYYAGGIGIPPETEPGHFREALTFYANKYGMSILEFEEKYKSGQIKDAETDRYFVHDRTLRESGHDTSWRLDNTAADLNSVDINSLLYKYETDLAFLLDAYFNGSLTADDGIAYSSAYFTGNAVKRKDLIKRYLWDEEQQGYFDYNIKTGRRNGFMSATNFFPLWAGICTQSEAGILIPQLFKHLKAPGGIMGSNKASAQHVAHNNVHRQWDYPNGWAPHQMLLWKGLLTYGFTQEAHELIYRWLYTITKNAADYNGVIPEKYDVVACTHKVEAEYGNVGTEFDYITRSGFGWMNASYQYGLSLLPEGFLEKLDRLERPEVVF